MAESQAKIRLTLDGQQATQEAKRIRGSVKSIGEEVGQWGRGLAKTLALSGAILGTVRAIGEAQANARREAAGLSKEFGDAALRLSVAMAKIKMPAQQAAAVNAIASVAPSEVAGIMESLAGKNIRPGADFVGAARAAQLGVFSQDEIVNALKRGKRIDISGRLGQMSPDALVEIQTRQDEQIKRAQARPYADAGTRLAEAELARRRLASPSLQAIADSAEAIAQFTGLAQTETIKGQLAGRSIGTRIVGSVTDAEDLNEALQPGQLLKTAQRLNRRIGTALGAMYGIGVDDPVDALDIEMFQRRRRERRAMRVEVTNRQVQWGGREREP